MPSKIKHNFKSAALALIRGDWANRIARHCSFWANGTGMACLFPENPDSNSPNLIALDVPKATNLIYQQMVETGLLSTQMEPLTIRTVKKQSGANVVVDYAIVYLQGTTLYFGDTAYTVQTGTGTGQLQSLMEDFPNWWKITGMTTGNFYLVETAKDSHVLKFASSPSSISGARSFKVAVVANASPWAVTQYKRSMNGLQVVTCGEEGGGTPLPDNVITGSTMTSGRFVMGAGNHSVAASTFLAPAQGEGLAVTDLNMSGSTNTLPIITRLASTANTGKIASSGIAVIEVGTKKCIKGSNVKIEVPSGSTLHEFDNVAVASDGTLMLDQTTYAWFDPDSESIEDGAVVVADGTEGKVKTVKKLGADKVQLFDDEELTLDTFFDEVTEKIADDALSFVNADGDTPYIDFDEIDAALGDGNAIIGTDEEGFLEEAAKIPQEPDTDKILGVKAGEKGLSFLDRVEGDSTATPFELRVIKNTQGTAISEVRVYLPVTTVTFGNTDWPIQTGSGSGQITAISGKAGWYRINGITSGTIYLVDASTSTTKSGVSIMTHRAKFATAKVSGVNKLNFPVGQVSLSSLVQFHAAKRQNPTDSMMEHDAQTPIDISTGAMANDLPTFQQEGHHLNTDRWVRGQTVLGAVSVHGDDNTITPITDADNKQALCGLKVKVYTRVVRAIDIDWFVWRELIFDKNGMLREMTAEKGVFGECNYAYS